MRLDQYLAKHYPEYSRSVWQKYVLLGYVTVNGTQELRTKAEITDTDSVVTTIPDKPDFSDDTLPVIYEDDHVVVVNKPVGVLSHSKGELNDEFTVAEFFRSRTTYNTDTNRPGIIHRLDRDTSGVMIGAKDTETAALLAKQFQDRRAKKTYYALVDKLPKLASANIDLPIGRNPNKPGTFRVDANGKAAFTHYEVTRSASSCHLLTLRPTTGRTHQLRVHLGYIGAPIIGDRLYGKPSDRLYLHAASLEITIPEGNRQTFTAPLPDEFNTMME